MYRILFNKNHFINKVISIFVSCVLAFSFFPQIGLVKKNEAIAGENVINEKIDSNSKISDNNIGKPVPIEEIEEKIANGEDFQLRDRSTIDYDTRYQSGNGVMRLKSLKSSTLPTKVDLRDYNGTNLVTDVKDQGQTGTCWSFGANATAETFIANSLSANAETSFSPYQAAYFGYSALSSDTSELKGTEISQAGEGITFETQEMKESYALKMGGNAYMVSSMMLSGVGPSKLSDIPFPDDSLTKGTMKTELSSEQRRYSLANLTKWDILGSLVKTNYDGSFAGTNETVLNAMKQELFSGNAIDISYFGVSPYDSDGEKYYCVENNAQYTYDVHGNNHAVCIVGYDDNFSKENFIGGHQPEKDGAFIVKNSWGDTKLDHGYFYLSYYDRSIMMASVFRFDTENYDGNNIDENDQIIDQYDYTQALDMSLGYQGSYCGSEANTQNSNAQWYSNVFTASQDQKLESIGTYYSCAMNELSYKVYRLKSDATNPNDVLGSFDSPVASGTYEGDYEGFVKIKLDKSLELKEGEKYAICFSQPWNRGRYFSPRNISEANYVYESKNSKGEIIRCIKYKSNAILNAGESFYMQEGSSEWKDLAEVRNRMGDYYAADNFCVKGYSTIDRDITKTLTFDSNGGTDVDSITVSNGTQIDEPNVPKKDNFSFDGWYYDKALTTKFDFSKPVTKNITVYAKWVANITYELNGGVTEEGANPSSYTFTVGVDSFVEPSKKGHRFLGWWTKDGTDGDWGDQLTSISKEYDAGGVALYAKWEIETYTITYNNLKDADNINKDSYKYGDEDIDLIDLNRKGYSFLGWWTKDGTNDDWGEQITKISKGQEGNVVLYAKWNLIEYKITYKNIEGAENPNPSYYTIEDFVQLKDVEKKGYEFVSWTRDEDEDLDSICSYISRGSTGDVTLYAKWKIRNYSITFDGLEGAQNPNEESKYYLDDCKAILYDIDTNATILKDAVKKGYEFNGWIDSEGNQITEYGGGSIGDLMLTATWTPIEYTITYKNAKDKINANPTKYTIDTETFTLFSFKKQGYTFNWYDSKNNKVTRIEKGSTGNKILNGKWTATDYTITYIDEKSANNANPTNYTIETATFTLFSLKKEGYKFEGWYDAENNRVTRIVHGSVGNKVLTAKWTKIEGNVTIKYVIDNTPNATVTLSKEIVEVATESIKGSTAVSPAGYHFVNWKCENQVVATTEEFIPAQDENTGLYEEKTYVANFAPNTNTKYLVKHFKQRLDGTYNSLPDATDTMSGTTATRTSACVKTYSGFAPLSFTQDIIKGDGTTVISIRYERKGYNLIYEYNDDVTLSSLKSYLYGQKIEEPKAPTRSGYTFAGWYSDAQLKTKFDFSKTTMPAEDLTLYAKWTANKAEVERISMYRLYNPYSGEHFYTKDQKEKANLVKLGWKDENVGWIAPSTSKTPVYRLYNPNSGDHHYTTNKSEHDSLVKVGWKSEGTGWYSDDNKGVALYRQYNPYAAAGSHNYASSKDENDSLIKVGWEDEGICWYGLK